jgi:hypothetical protein
MTQYDKIASLYNTNELKNSFREDFEYYTFLYRLLLPSMGIKDVTTTDLKKVLKNQYVLDLGCGAGYYTQ